MIPVRYVDFPALLGDLIERGYYTNAGLARELNCPDSTVRMWRAGHKPPHHYGEALVKTLEVATLWIRRQSESDAARTGARGQASPPRIDRQCAWIEGGIRCRCAGVTSVGAHVDSPWYCAEHLERVERGERGDAPPPRAAMSAQARLH